MNQIAVIGAGTMGNGIAHVFAMHGMKVSLVDVNPSALEKALATIEKNLQRMVKKEKISEDDQKKTLDSIQTFTDIPSAVKNADLVVEAASENFSIKAKIFNELDQAAPEHAILATNTSSISISRIAAETQRPQQVIGMHFMNPVPVMKLVEVIRGYDTTDQVVQSVLKVSEQIHKIPVPANDYPGFVANRILMPMINEAIYSLHEGVAGVDEIDRIMKLGMAHPMGPLQLADFIGLDVCLSILNVLYDGFKQDKYAACPLLVNMVTAGKLGIKSGEGFYDYSEGPKNAVVAPNFQ